MTRSDKIKLYQKEIKIYLNKYIEVSYKRSNDITNTLCGKVIKLRKTSFILRINDEKNVSIGFRNITNHEKL